MDALDFLRMITESEYERKVRDFYDDSFDNDTIVSNYGDLTKRHTTNFIVQRDGDEDDE
jgi:hypothetical protein